MASHDWFEGVSVVLGVVFALAAVACLWAFGVALASLNDPADAGLATARGILQGSSDGTVHVSRAFALVLFGILGLLSLAVSWFLTGDVIRRAAKRLRGEA
jgi:hypothetical protein